MGLSNYNMKIGFDVRPLLDAQYSGVAEFTFELLTHLLAAAPEDDFLLYSNSFRGGRLPEFSQSNARSVATRYPNKLFNYGLQKLLGHPKLDRLLGAEAFLAPHLNFYALSGRVPSLLVVHDLSFLRYPDFFSWRKNVWHRQLAVVKLVNRFDRIVAISENTRRDLVELAGLPEEKISVIHSGVGSEFRPLSKDDPALAGVRKKYGLPGKFILSLGTIEPRKNIEGLIQAYELLLERRPDLAEFELVVAGGRGWKNQQIYRRFAASPQKDRIKFIGYVERADKAALYNLASLFVYPSFYEGFGFPPLEAMASGAPVVTSFASSLPEVAGRAALPVDPYDFGDIATAMEQVLADHELAACLRERGLVQARKFSWQDAAASYLELIRKM